jgi:hypothetical protein
LVTVSLETVPALPQMRELTLDDRALIEGLLAREPPDTSELTFTNLFIWRDAYALRLSRVDGALLMFSWRADPEDSFLLPPLGARDGAAAVEAGLRHLRENGHDPKLGRISAAQLERLGVAAERFDLQPDRDNWDYVYQVRELIELAGEKYHGKRNHMAQFMAENREWEYRRLTPDLVAGCETVQELWCDEKHCDLYSSLRAEARAVKEALRNLDRLSAIGGCILVRGEVAAFTLGEALNQDTVTIHLEKANAAFHGLYQVINQQFLEREWQRFAYVNRQQDLGIEGLRKAKLSYYPHHLVEKHIVRQRPRK